jgi:glycerophosphoryl diester phosphodiesterase
MNIASKYTDCWLDLFASTATEAIVNNAHINNIPIITWTTDNTITADELIRIGVDVVTSNSITKL